MLGTDSRHMSELGERDFCVGLSMYELFCLFDRRFRIILMAYFCGIKVIHQSAESRLYISFSAMHPPIARFQKVTEAGLSNDQPFVNSFAEVRGRCLPRYPEASLHHLMNRRKHGV